MAIGALIIALAYVLLAVLTSTAGAASVAWWWLLVFFGLFTLGELYILPTGLGLFARLAPPGHTATTVAAWFLAIFSGSLAAGAAGTLWSELSHAAFFVCLAGLALLAGVLLFLLEPLAARIEAQRAGSRSD
jgi:POT family proton-dependent oligopeptide transporter